MTHSSSNRRKKPYYLKGAININKRKLKKGTIITLDVKTKPSQQECGNCKNPAPNKWIAIDIKGNCAVCGTELEGKKLFPPQQECCECYCEKCRDCYRQPCKIHKPSHYTGTPTTTSTGTYFPSQKKDTHTYEETLETVRRLSKLMKKEGWDEKFDEDFVIVNHRDNSEGFRSDISPKDVKSFIRTEIEKTVLSVIGENELDYNPKSNDGHNLIEREMRNTLRSEQRAKLQRILKKV